MSNMADVALTCCTVRYRAELPVAECLRGMRDERQKKKIMRIDLYIFHPIKIIVDNNYYGQGREIISYKG